MTFTIMTEVSDMPKCSKCKKRPTEAISQTEADKIGCWCWWCRRMEDTVSPLNLLNLLTEEEKP